MNSVTESSVQLGVDTPYRRGWHWERTASWQNDCSGCDPRCGLERGGDPGVAREAEAAGFDAIFAAEVNNDVMATAQLMGAATSRIQVGTWIANIYLRHSYTCAQGAALIADATGGRFILGLGVSHQPVNQALGIAMPHPLATLRQYVTEVRGWLRGEGPATHLPQRPSPQPVPLYVAALGERAVELGGELADGIMPLFWTAERVAQSKAWAARGRARAPTGTGGSSRSACRPSSVTICEALRETARQNLVLYTGLPFFQRLFRAWGSPRRRP